MGNDSSKKPSGESSTLTQIDLGDDLIAPRVDSSEVKGAALPSTADDRYENARILAQEGFIEDAKKLLRKILISDPKHVAAKESLNEILDREMKELLTEQDSIVKRPRLFERKGKGARTPQSTSDELVNELEQIIGMDSEDPAPFPKLNADAANLKSATAADRVDLGIAFMEMGAYEQAISHFRAALDQLESQLAPDFLSRVSASALLARAYLASNRAYEAMQLLHSIVRDNEIGGQDKIECFYLMGLAHERIGNRKAALPWYGKVRDIDPQYRDIQERLRKPIA